MAHTPVLQDDIARRKRHKDRTGGTYQQPGNGKGGREAAYRQETPETEEVPHRGNRQEAEMQDALSRRRQTMNPHRIQIADQQQYLEHGQTGDPDAGTAPELRQQHAPAHGLQPKQQPRTEAEYGRRQQNPNGCSHCAVHRYKAKKPRLAVAKTGLSDFEQPCL